MPYGCHDSFLSLEPTIDYVVVFSQLHLYYNLTHHSVYRPKLKIFGQKHNMWYVSLTTSSIDCYCELLHNQFVSPHTRLDVKVFNSDFDVPSVIRLNIPNSFVVPKSMVED